MNDLPLFFFAVKTSEKIEIVDPVRWNRLQKKHHEQKVSHVFRTYREKGIEPVLIKGLACCAVYPPDVPRQLGDIDLAVSTTDFPRANELARSGEFRGYLIDIHRELRQLDALPWRDLLKNSRLIAIDGTDIRILAAEDHLRVICTHWLIDGGANKEKLWDVYYAVKNRSKDFDWKRCLDVVGAVRRNWIITAISIAHEYLDLKIDDLPFRDEITDLPRWMKKCVEREWRSDLQVTGIPSPRDDLSGFFNQILKRIPPNPIAATIECEGKFSHKRPTRCQLRVLYRFGRRAIQLAKRSLFGGRAK